MKFALCTETYEDLPLEEVFSKAAAHGYQGVEIAPFQEAVGEPCDVRTIDASRRARLASAARKAGVEVAGLHWLLARTEGLSITSPDAGTRARTAEYLGELAELCTELGGRFLVFGSPQQRQLQEGETFADGLPRAAEVFGMAADTCERLGVQLLIEPLSPAETRFVNTKDEAVRVIEEVGSDAVGLQLDVKAMSSEEKPVPEIIKEAAPFLRHFHANDELGRGPGFGPTDFTPVAEALKKIGYEGWVSVEPFDTSPGPDVVAEKSLAYLRDCFGQ